MIDRVKQSVLARWPIETAQSNFPMVLIEASRRILVATRKPAKLLALDTASGKALELLGRGGAGLGLRAA